MYSNSISFSEFGPSVNSGLVWIYLGLPGQLYATQIWAHPSLPNLTGQWEICLPFRDPPYMFLSVWCASTPEPELAFDPN